MHSVEFETCSTLLLISLAAQKLLGIIVDLAKSTRRMDAFDRDTVLHTWGTGHMALRVDDYGKDEEEAPLNLRSSEGDFFVDWAEFVESQSYDQDDLRPRGRHGSQRPEVSAYLSQVARQG